MREAWNDRLQFTRQRVIECVMMSVASIALAAVLVLLLVLVMSLNRAVASEQYPTEDVASYYASLKQPDSPGASCCGAGDAYWADKVDTCRPSDPENCALIAIITDDRPDDLKLPDGRVIHRPHMEIGTRIPVPKSKIRKPAQPNPTDHNIIFAAQYEGDENSFIVWCWEPMALI